MLAAFLSINSFAQFIKNPPPIQPKPQNNQAPANAPQNTPPPPPPVKTFSKEATKYFQKAMQGTDLNKVVQDLSKAIELEPTYTEAIFYRGVANYHNKNGQKAVNDFDKCIQMNPRHFGAYAFRGRAKESLNLMSDALSDYNTALKLNPKFGEGYYYRGMYFKNATKDTKKACDDLKEAKKFGYNVSENDLKGCE
jgi:tetratricopeptide (TPR) repeat protein